MSQLTADLSGGCASARREGDETGGPSAEPGGEHGRGRGLLGGAGDLHAVESHADAIPLRVATANPVLQESVAKTIHTSLIKYRCTSHRCHGANFWRRQVGSTWVAKIRPILPVWL